MDRLRFKATVYFVFLLVSLVINGIMLFMLMNEDMKECVDVVNDPEHQIVEQIADSVYKAAYNYINGEESFVKTTSFVHPELPNQSCVLVDFTDSANYFTKKAINDLQDGLVINGDSYYDCTNNLDKIRIKSLFGTTNQGIRILKYVVADDNTIVVEGNIPADMFSFYLILKKENGRWLIDSFE